MFQEKVNHIEDETIDLAKIINVIKRRKYVILLTVILCMGAIRTYMALKVPMYRAVSLLYLENGKEGSRGDNLLFMVPRNTVASEIEIIKSRSIAENTVKKLNLDRVISKRSAGMDFTIGEFEPDSTDGRYRIVLDGRGHFSIYNDNNLFIGKGESGKPLSADGVRILISLFKGEKGDSFQIRKLPMHVAVTGLKGSLKVKEAQRGASILEISYVHRDPDIARDVVNAIVENYLNMRIMFKAEEASKISDFIDEQLDKIRIELDSAERDLKEYKKSEGIIRLDANAQEMLNKVSEVEKLKAETDLQKRQMRYAISNLRNAIRTGKIYSPSIMQNDPLITSLASKLAEVENRKSTLLVDYSEKHPMVINLNEQIKEMQKKILATYETSYRNLSEKERSYKMFIKKYDRMMKKLPQAEMELARRLRVSKVNSDIYIYLLQKQEEAKISKAAVISNVKIIDPAISPWVPVKPKFNPMIIGFLTSLIFGISLAFFIEFYNATVTDIEDVQDEFGMPVLALIPRIIHKPENNEDSKYNSMLITYYEPHSPVSEIFRLLMTGVHFMSINEKDKCVLFTSCFPGEGKTTLIGNFGLSLADFGNNVLLIDCDLRKPSLHNLLGHSQYPGLTDLLAGDISLKSVVQKTGLKGLDLISAGTIPPNPLELLGSEKMQKLVQDFKSRYDYLLIDTPPILTVSDAQYLIKLSGMLMLVVEAGRITAKTISRVKEVLNRVDPPIVGITVNNKKMKEKEIYDYYGGYYRDYN